MNSCLQWKKFHSTDFKHQMQQIKSNQNLLSLVLHHDNHVFLYGDAHEDIYTIIKHMFNQPWITVKVQQFLNS